MLALNPAKFEICENTGNLIMTVDAETQAELKRALDHDDLNYWNAMFDLFEYERCNGSYEPFDAGRGNPFVGLTDAPCVAESMDCDDDGNQSVDGRLWYSASYDLENELETLAKTGRFVWTYAPSEAEQLAADLKRHRAQRQSAINRLRAFDPAKVAAMSFYNQRIESAMAISAIDCMPTHIRVAFAERRKSLEFAAWFADAKITESI